MSPSTIWRASVSSGAFTSVPSIASSISAWEYTSSARNSVSSASASPAWPHEAERLASRADEAPDRPCPTLAHRAHEQPIRAALGDGLRGDEEVGAIQPHRIDGVERDEVGDLDHARVVVALDRLQLGLLDDDELPLGYLEPLDEVVT